VVYRAVQLGTKREVALKVLLEESFAADATRRRFEREIELAAALRHPNIVRILDSGVTRGRYYFAMEYVAGLRLDRYIAQRRPPLPEVLRLFEKICAAVNFAHQRGVLHRDLKPSNILVDEHGEPQILDFGLAKPLRNWAGSSDSTWQVLSMSGQLLGTVAYMSPEQAAGSPDVDVRSDVYSLGVVFYEALLGRPPYSVEGPLGEVLQRIAHDEPLNPQALGRRDGLYRVGDELATILLKALEKDPQRRYQTVGDLGRDFSHLLAGEPIEAKRASGLYILKKTLRRYRFQAATAGLILVMLLGFLVTLAVLLAREREARREADAKSAEARQAVMSERAALREARRRTSEALLAQQELRRALARQHIRRGDLALERAELAEARDSYWRAMQIEPGPAAVWALRRYYIQTSDFASFRLAFDRPATTALSPKARLAAVCFDDATICVRSLDETCTQRFLVAPGEVRVLGVTDAGAVAAGGEGWVCAWRPAELRPAVVALLDEQRDLRAIYPIADGSGVLLVTPRAVFHYRGAGGEEVHPMPLRAALSGQPDFHADLQLLAVPTTAGVEAVTILSSGELRSEIVWTGPSPSAVRFAGADELAILTDALYVCRTRGPQAWQSNRVLDVAGQWDFFELDSESGTGLLAARDGRLTVFRNATPGTGWRHAARRIEQVRLLARQRAIVTIDDHGVATRWAEPASIEQRRRVHDSAPQDWAASADGSTVLLAFSRGQVLAYRRGDGDQSDEVVLRTILRPRLLGLTGDMALAVSADGRRALVRDRSTLRYVGLDDLTTRTLFWDHPTLNVLGGVALSGDGRLVALMARNPLGDRQQLVLQSWPDQPSAGSPAAIGSVDFVGAAVRAFAFWPGSDRLLLSRSNGELALMERSAMTPSLQTRPWMRLESSADMLVFNRTGEYLAAAGAGDVVLLITTSQAMVRFRLHVGQPVAALAFNPRDDALLVRTLDGTVRLFDPAGGEVLVTWPLAAPGARPLAAWSGQDDSLLLTEEGGLYEYRFASADAAIQRNAAHAREQQVAGALTDADYASAWKAAGELAALAPTRGHAAQLAVLRAALRRPGSTLPTDAAALVLWNPDEFIAVGHAAYEGERFDLARQWLRRAYEETAGALDTLTLWRLASCDYLAEDYDLAAAELSLVLERGDLDASRAALVALQRVAALLLAGRPAQARLAAMEVGGPDRAGRYPDIVSATYASVISRLITGIERESTAATALDSLLANIGERSLLFQDDQHFFAGEILRQRGELERAAVSYQRCVDLARDAWPANWARYRLAHLQPGDGG